MRFKLQQKSVGPALTVFDVTDDKSSIVGRINVRNEDAGDLQKCWLGAKSSAAAAKQPPAGVPFKIPPMSKAAILRGC